MIYSFAGGHEAAGTDCTNEHKVAAFVNSKFTVAGEGDGAEARFQSLVEMNSRQRRLQRSKISSCLDVAGKRV